MSADGVVGSGDLTWAVTGKEDLGVVDVVFGSGGGEMGVGSESLAKGAPDLLGVVAGTPGRSHDCVSLYTSDAAAEEEW